MKTLVFFTQTIRKAAVLLLFVLLVPALHAQQQDQQQQNQPAPADNGNSKKDKIEVIHTAYLTEKLNLTPEVAQKFWPIYNQFRAEQATLQKQRKQNAQMIKDAGGIDNMSDDDVKKLVANEIDVKTRELDLHKKYVVKFQDAITLKQVAKLFAAEEQFKIYLLNQLKARKNARGGRGGDNNADNQGGDFIQQ